MKGGYRIPTDPRGKDGYGRDIWEAVLVYEDGREEKFDVDWRGMIRDPGKFEGEFLYVPYYWDLGMLGFADDDDGRVFRFTIGKEDKAMFKGLLSKKQRVLKLYEDEQGFVRML